VSKPFFLTRQTANLMEDFARELKEGSSLFLLYGEDGVGKTRLLEELGHTRLAERAIFWLDLDSGDQGDETRMERSTEVEASFAGAGNGDIIIADHFEAALKKTRHQLFLSWSTDGIDKQINLIIASNIEGFNELRQLWQHYQVRVESFQQMPFSDDEVQSFLGFYLFPNNPVVKLSIPSPLRKQIAAAHGNVGRVIEIIERDGDQIQSAAPVEQTESIRQGSRIIFAVLFLFVLAVGVGWYFFGQPRAAEPPPFASTETEVSASQSADEPGTASDSEAVIDEPIDEAPLQASLAAAPEPIPANNRQRFDLELQQSLEWLGQRENRAGTVQILLLSYDNFDHDNYYEYVAELARRGADPEQLHVFKTYTGNREVYSVMYGEFTTRRAAINAIDGLPKGLRDTSPLGRSVGGIWQEIRRLESKN
jgi:hypothetical protein